MNAIRRTTVIAGLTASILLATGFAAPAEAHGEGAWRYRPRWHGRHERGWVGRPPVVRTAPVALCDQEFDGLVWSIQRARWSGERVAMIRDAARHSRFTSAQVVALVELVAFSSQRVEAAAALYPSVVDPWSFHAVYDCIPFWGDRDDLRRRVAYIDAARAAPQAGWPRS